MDTALIDRGLEVRDLEFIPEHVYCSLHGCGQYIIAKGTEMKTEMDRHTADCEWTEPTA